MNWIDEEINEIEARYLDWESLYEFIWKNIRGIEEEELTEQQRKKIEEIKENLKTY